MSESVTIETESDAVRFTVEGELGNGQVTLKPNQGETKEDAMHLQIEENVKLSFALRYLNMFNKASILSQ